MKGDTILLVLTFFLVSVGKIAKKMVVVAGVNYCYYCYHNYYD